MRAGEAYDGRTVGDTVESSVSAVSWPAIVAGGLTAVAVTLILLMLGAGLGLSSISPWSGQGASATTIAIGAVIWLVVVQWIASAMGGYVAGRLRTAWTGVHRDEVFFRDTAHGLLAWALATMLGFAFLGSAASSIVGAGASAIGSAAEGAARTAAAAVGPVSQYDIDALLRRSQPATGPEAVNGAEVSAEITRIIGNGLSTGQVPTADRAYLAQVVAARAGIPAQEAEQRVNQAIERAQQAAARAKEAADTARKSAARLALFGALAMLIGAFVASAGAAYGGHLRDEPS